MSAFQKATKKKAKLRLALFGASGSGKTYTALRIAKGLGGKVAVIDSERGSASKYSDRFDFDVVELDEQRIENYIGYINEAEKGCYEVLIIDSMSHAWQELLQEVEKIAQAQFKGNTWSAWSKGTPKQKSLVDALLQFNGHIIATMRSKTEWVIEQSNGKNKPTRVGMSPEQGKGIEYEFDLLIEITPEHYGNVLKDRTGKFQDKTIEKPDEKFGKELSEWLSDGADIIKKEFDHEKKTKAQHAITSATTEKQLDDFLALIKKYLDEGQVSQNTYDTLAKEIDTKLKQLQEKK